MQWPGNRSKRVSSDHGFNWATIRPLTVPSHRSAFELRQYPFVKRHHLVEVQAPRCQKTRLREELLLI
jgi:hypothetical protein